MEINWSILEAHGELILDGLYRIPDRDKVGLNQIMINLKNLNPLRILSATYKLKSGQTLIVFHINSVKYLSISLHLRNS